MYKFIFSLFFIFLSFSACSSQPKAKPVVEPLWLAKPNLNGKTGAVGSSKPQFKGKTVQRRVAISRALDELAQQSGVEVGNIMMRNEKVNSIGASYSTQVQSTQRTSGVTVHAHIEEVWTDPRTKEMHIWLVAD